MGATVIRTSGSEGASCGSVSMCEWIFVLQVFPHRAHYQRRRGSGDSPPGALSAPKGEWQYTKATTREAAPTSPPEGVFRHKRRMELDELLGRTTGRLRLGHTWPTTAYAIGGTATLALRYSIISATAAASTHPPG